MKLRASSESWLWLAGATAFLQGATYLTQAALAFVLSPAQFGIVRGVESLLAVALVFAGLGQPTLMIREIATAADSNEQARWFRDVVSAAGLASVCVGVLGLSLALAFITGEQARWVTASAGLLLLTPLMRTSLNWYQGRRQFHRYAWWSAAIGLLAVGTTLSLALLFGLRGWLTGRYLGEGLGLLVAVLALRRAVPRVGWRPGRLRLLMGEGLEVAVALGLRTLLDNLPLILLAFALGFADPRVGIFGFATLVWGVALLPGSAMAASEFPRLSALSTSGPELRSGVRRALGHRFALSAGLSAAALLLAWSGVWLLLPAYRDSALLAAVLIAGVPLRTAAMIAGSTLVILQRNRVAIALNLVLVLLSVPTFWAAIDYGSLAVLCLAALTLEGVGCVLFVGAAQALLRNR